MLREVETALLGSSWEDYASCSSMSDTTSFRASSEMRRDSKMH